MRGKGSWFFRLLRICLVLLVLAALAAGGAALWLRRAMQAQLPQLDGDRHTVAVTQPVTVQRDRQGVPTSPPPPLMTSSPPRATWPHRIASGRWT